MAKDQNLLALAAAINAAEPRLRGLHREVAEEDFRMVLGPFGFKHSETDDWLKDAKDKLRLRKLPWSLAKGPISWTRVHRAFQKHEQHENKRQVVYGQHDYAHLADLMWEHYELLGDLDRAKQLLEKLSPDEFRRYRKRYEQIVAEIHAKPAYGK
jgi:hypothetical protein